MRQRSSSRYRPAGVEAAERVSRTERGRVGRLFLELFGSLPQDQSGLPLQLFDLLLQFHLFQCLVGSMPVHTELVSLGVDAMDAVFGCQFGASEFPVESLRECLSPPSSERR